MSESLNKKVTSATKWSAITEIAAKLITPISTMVLARLLTPEAFGILVTATMVISFAEIFTDAGFQKYIVQNAFKDEISLYNSTAVAFWSNLFFSIIVWIGICIFSSKIAYLVGNEGYGFVIAVSCICIPLAAFSSIQMALFKRKLDFKTLFLVRIIGILIPILVTIPLAFLTRSYWALIIGMIALNLCNAIILTWKSEWKPQWYYKLDLFRNMFSFTIWSMLESVSIWLTGYIDVFIVGATLNTYYMGIYRTSISTVGQIMSIVTAATTPVLFSALSRLQEDEIQFKKMYFTFQKIVGILVIPFGVSIFLFRDVITSVLLGSNWSEASYMIGWWGLTSSITIVLSHYSSEVFRAKGKPKYSFGAQVLHLFFLIPTVIISIKYDFQTLCLSRSLIRFTMIIICVGFLYKLVKITPFEMISNIWHSCLAALGMCVIYSFLPEVTNTILRLMEIIPCAVVYLVIISLWKDERSLIIKLQRQFVLK